MSHRLVTRVPEYEPEPVLASLAPRRCRTPHSAALHRHSRRSPTGIARQSHHHDTHASAHLLAFADATIRRVLEAVDRRRPVAHLRPLLSDGALSAVTARATHLPAANPARLRKVRVRPCPPHCGVRAAELFGTYQRGERVAAIAGRIEYAGGRWLVVALQIG